MQGALSQIGLTDVLQLCILTKKSGQLRLSRGNETVDIYFIDGEVAHAVSPLGEGEKAFFHPLTWSEGNFTLIKDGAVPQKTVTRPTHELLSEWLGVSRELERIQEIVPTENAVFRIAEADAQFSRPISLSGDEWKILSRINSTRSVKAIAQAAQLPYFEAAKILCVLHKEGLVQLASGAAAPARETAHKTVADPVPQGFFDRMVHGLAEVSGPIASVVVRDQIAALGATEDAFPKSRIPELVESVCQVIPDKRLKARFQQRMSEEIRALKVPPANPQNFTL